MMAGGTALPVRNSGAPVRTLCVGVVSFALFAAITACGSARTLTGGDGGTTISVPVTGGEGTTTSVPDAPKTNIKVFADCQTPTAEPTSIVLECGDGGIVLQGLTWNSWTANEATGKGVIVYNDCNPNCALGHKQQIPNVTVVLTSPVQASDGTTVFSKINENPEPPGFDVGPNAGQPQNLPTRPI